MRLYKYSTHFNWLIFSPLKYAQELHNDGLERHLSRQWHLQPSPTTIVQSLERYGRKKRTNFYKWS